MTYRLAFNPTDSPVLIDSEGRSCAGQDWCAADDAEQAVTDALALGRLIWPEEPTNDDDTPASRALARANELNGPTQPSSKSTKKTGA